MTESSRSKTLEVMARAISIDLGEDPDALDVLIHDRPGTRPHWEGYESAAQAALTAYESHLQAEGMAVVPVATLEYCEQEMAVWARVLPHPQAGNSDLRYLQSLAIMRRLSASPYGKAVVKEKDDE